MLDWRPTMPYSKILSYDYLRLLDKDPKTQKIIGETYAAVIPVRISYGHRLSVPFNALVDSGASVNLFPARFGEQIGINIKKGKLVKLLGIGDKIVFAYSHKIKLLLGLKVFETYADFSFEQNLPLLGRNGFFNLFQKVIFDENFHQLSLVLKTKS